MPHRNAPLTELGRLRLARCIVDDGWPVARAAERFQVSRPTATRWAQRYRQLGAVGMQDRSSRPHRSPRRTAQPTVRKIVHLRWKQRLGPVAIAARVGLAPSTVHRILTACQISRLWHVDRVTGEPVRRYDMSRPGELVHVDIKKLGNVPDGGSWVATRAAATAKLTVIPTGPAPGTAGRTWATAMSTARSTPSPAWPTAKRWTTRPPPPPWRSGPVPARSSPDTGSAWSGS